MKAPDFAYVRAGSLENALAILAEFGDGALPLAGGQSLLAGLNMRLSAPELLVDIGDLDELRGITEDDDVLRIGALVRHCELLRSPLIATRLPLLAEAASHIGHVAIRNRGTFGGSLAYADPAAELPACTVALGGTIVVAGTGGRRNIPAASFFKGLLETDLRPGELIVEIRLPAQRSAQSWGFAELSRRHGDFAMAGVAAVASLEAGRIGEARLAYFGCAAHAKRATAVEAALRGQTLSLTGDVLSSALAADLDPTDSPGYSAATKLRLAAVLTARVIGGLRSAAA